MTVATSPIEVVFRTSLIAPDSTPIDSGQIRMNLMSSAFFRYRAYGLVIHSELPLPELVQAEPSDLAPEGSVSVRLGSVPSLPNSVERAGRNYYTADSHGKICWPGVGGFLVQDGRSITVDPSPDSRDDLVRLHLLGPVMNLLLRQRGHLILHASAVELSSSSSGMQEAVAFLGDSGAGKSTMAAALHRRGHRLVSDDSIAISETTIRERSNTTSRLTISPGYPQLKLWPDSLQVMGDAEGDVLPLSENYVKLGHSVPRGFSSRPVPLRSLCILETGESISCEPLHGAEALMAVVDKSYWFSTMSPEEKSTNLRHCTEVVNRLSVYRLRRPLDWDRLPEIAQTIEELYSH